MKQARRFAWLRTPEPLVPLIKYFLHKLFRSKLFRSHFVAVMLLRKYRWSLVFLLNECSLELVFHAPGLASCRRGGQGQGQG